jgi:hypothetical protein
MQGAAAPVNEATVSDDLRALLADIGWRRSGTGTRARDLSPPPPDRPSAASTDSAQPPAIPWRDIALRRDGMRPLRLRGLLVHRTEVRAGGGGARLSLYATPDGSAVAQLSYEPPGTLPVRPVFRVTPIHGPEDLDRFVGAIGPEQCFAVNPASLDDTARAACDLLRLPAILPGLARPDAPSRHSCEGKTA